ncbi:MAG: S41 family peptidase [Planctomycetota bacterium]|nr:S41 family peptidase [Planctomycetota bacterium]
MGTVAANVILGITWGGNMQLGRPTRKLQLLTLLLGLLFFSSSVTYAEPPLPLDLDDSRSALSIGEEMERSSQWLDAVRHYERALERWPEDENLKYGRRRAQVHFRVERRYSDQSFKNSLLGFSQDQALDLFDETASRIRNSFVDPLSQLSIVAHGTESLYIALANPKFVEANLPAAITDEEKQARRKSIQNFRSVLREQYWNKQVYNSQHARSVIVEVTRHASESLKIVPAAVVMEYVFGGCNALDDYSGFLTADRLSDLYSNIDGEFVGLGVEMKEEKDAGMLLVNVLPESPASVGGLRKGDRITWIDGKDIRTASIDEAAAMMRGQVGSRVKLRIERPSDKRDWEAVLIRRAVQVKSIPVAEIVDVEYGIGYIELSGFQKTTAEELDAALEKLGQQGMNALVLDVRGNPGGLLTAAVSVLDRFIENGVLVSTKGRTGDQNWTYRAHRQGTLNVPLALLTDGDSASASEIVAGAVRDHSRGTIVGRKTYGKWSVQSIFNVGRDTGLRLTTAKFFSPDGHNHSKTGVAPDVLVEEPVEHNVAWRGNNPEDERDADLERAKEILRRQVK